MNTKSFVISGFLGGIVNFLLGWLFYGMLFASYFPQPSESDSSAMAFIAIGAFSVAFFIAFVFGHWAQISTVKTGAIGGTLIGLFMGIIANAFGRGMDASITFERMIIDLAITIVMYCIVGAVIGLLMGKLKN